MPPLKIAIIGTGIIGPRHAKAVQQDPEAELVCIVDPNPAAEDVAHDLGTILYASVKEMLGSVHKPEAAIVCTPNHTHVSVSKELLTAGIHILVEKPISVDIESGSNLVQYALERNLRLLVGHHRRFNKYVLATKRLLSTNSLGRIIAVSGLWTLYKPPEYFDAPMEWHRTAGTISINLTHEIDVLQYLLGPIVRVHAEKSISQRGHLAEEGAAIILRFESGVVGTFLLSDAVPSPHNFEAGTGENPMIPRVGKDVYRVFGTEAVLSVPDMQRWSYGKDVEKSWCSKIQNDVMEVAEEKAPFELQLRHLIDVVRRNEEPKCSGSDGLSAVVVCEAVRKAMESGLPVDIET